MLPAEPGRCGHNGQPRRETTPGQGARDRLPSKEPANDQRQTNGDGCTGLAEFFESFQAVERNACIDRLVQRDVAKHTAAARAPTAASTISTNDPLERQLRSYRLSPEENATRCQSRAKRRNASGKCTRIGWMCARSINIHPRNEECRGGAVSASRTLMESLRMDGGTVRCDSVMIRVPKHVEDVAIHVPIASRHLVGGHERN